VDSGILMAAMLGAAFGLAVVVLVVKRQWWKASGICALGTMFLLDNMTEGNRSRTEHNVVLAIGLVLLAYFLAVVVAATATQTRRHDRM
jgi:hypothetical protein